METSSEMLLIENLRELERMFTKRHQMEIKRSQNSGNSARTVIPVGSEIYEQVLKEMRCKNNTHDDSSNAQLQYLPKAVSDDGNVSVPESNADGPTHIDYSEESIKSSEMYLSCNKYPWVCVTTKCVHQSWKTASTKWKRIADAGMANIEAQHDDNRRNILTREVTR